jgi:hypothetical protein
METTRLGFVLLGKLMELPIREKYRIAARAGMDVSEVPEVQNNAVVNPAISRAFAKLDTESKQRALSVLADAIAANDGERRKDLERLLRQHGYEYVDGSFVPVGLIDQREAPNLPVEAQADLSQAMTRLANNDEGGAITLACGAVDKVMTAIYKKNGWTDFPNSFQARVNTAMQRLGIVDEMNSELQARGIGESEAEKTAVEMTNAIKHAANALEVIRRSQGDAHGSKPTYRRIVYDTIKWSAAICGLFEGKV